ncbi:MAG: heavy metal translocating P-type ATPase [Opitutales bacterium]
MSILDQPAKSTEPEPTQPAGSCCEGVSAQAPPVALPTCPACGPVEARESSGASGRWWRLGAALVISGQSMVFGLAWNLYRDEVGEAAVAEQLGATGYWIYHGVLLASALAVLGLLGGPLLRRNWAALLQRRVTVELLFALTLLGALGGSLVSTLTGTGAVYYEVVAIVLCVYTFGRLASERSRGAVLAAADRLRQQFDTAYLLRSDGRTESVPVSQISAGQQVRVLPGEAICVDAIVESGQSYVSETSLNGEPLPVVRRAGDRVRAGTIAVDGTLTLRVTHAWGERVLDGILRTVGEARMKPSTLQVQADAITRWFVPVVVTVSLGTFVAWLILASWPVALFNAMAVLLVACPCALGLATPVAVWGGLQRLTTWGLVARSGQLLDDLARVTTVCFDKTGTLSEHELVAVDLLITSACPLTRTELRTALATAEAPFAHPIARALVRAAEGPDNPWQLEHSRVHPGQGIEAEICAGERRHTLRIGEPGLLGGNLGESETVGLDDSAASEWRSVFVSVDGVPAARVTLLENLRGEVGRIFQNLQQQGLSVEILTGDPQPLWKRIEGVKLQCGLSPANKTARVEALQSSGERVLFVGDGLNDAPVLATGSASLAMGQGAELATASADGVLLGENLEAVPKAISLGRKVRQGVRHNLYFAAGYNGIGIALAAFGQLHPVVAALLMVGSSAFVSVRALRSTQATEGL